MAPQLNKGIFVPVPTFFDENDNLDLESIDKHVQFLGKTGISGIVVLGSIGEAESLTEDERAQVISQYTQSVQKHDPTLQVVVSIRARGVKLTSLRLHQAKDAGVGFALLSPPSYQFGTSDYERIKSVFSDILDESPLAIVISNYSPEPEESHYISRFIYTYVGFFDVAGVVIGDENESEMIGHLNESGRAEGIPLFGSSIDNFVSDMKNGADSIITEMGNIFPSVCVDIQKKFKGGNVDEASKLQSDVAKFIEIVVKTYRISAYKSLIQSYSGYGKGIVRGPLVNIAESTKPTLATELRTTYDMESAFQLQKH